MSATSSRTIDNVSLAYFAAPQHVSDAVRDLCTAGFEPAGINLSGSSAQAPPGATRELPHGMPLPSAIGSHTLRWLWKRARAHDRHRRGADQLNGRDPVPSEGSNPTCASFDLHVALPAMSVPPAVIRLLQQDALHRGMFLLVDAEGRVEEADTILDENAGHLRTQYLTVLSS